MDDVARVNGPEVPLLVETGPSLAIDAVVVPKLSFASHQNAVPVLRDLKVLNLGASAVENVLVDICADPPVFEAAQWRIDRIPAGGESHITKRDLKLNAGLLLQLSEAVRATVTLRAQIKGVEAGAALRDFPVELLARNEWGGAATMPELLAAFALPNDPAVGRLVKGASEVLRRAGRPDGIDGYQSQSRTRSHELLSAIWSAVSSLRLTYAEPPASFELQGQKVRTPSQAVEGGLATCLDTALMFTAVVEQAGLYPVIVLTRGHSFTGAWFQPQEFATLLVHDAASLRKRVALQELVLFETTLATGAHPAAFSRAIAEANWQIAEEREEDFVLALDIRRARMQRLRPLAMVDAQSVASSAPAPDETNVAGDALEAAPAMPDFDLADPEAVPTTSEGRLERWQRKLLDLTTRNRLLNVKPGTTVIRLLCPDPSALEDRLADGGNFRIVAAPEMEGEAGRDRALHLQRTGEVLDLAYARDALERGEIVSLSPAGKLDTQLIELYRKTRLDLAEGGANTLFLTIGFLLWRKSESDTRHYRAPLLLLPVKLERRSVRSGVKLSALGEEPRFNLTLLQMLRQDFDLDIPELGGALPTDDSGIDVARIWNLVRRAVRDTPGFEVAEDVVLGSFSFAKYLMWKDLVDRTEALKANPVVRHLLETPREPYQACEEPPRPDELDRLVGPDELFTPLPADSSQLSAVIGSARGCDFVLDGPPGTGKSQTIANMIAHNLALGRKVLFVAEKRAALDVVHRRLVAHGLGPFCLELHSNKASKQDVLRQLDAAWTAAEASPAEAWARNAAQLRTSRDHLNRLVEALHRRRSNGMTLYDAIGRVVRDGAGQVFRLPWPHGANHSEADLERFREAARKLDLHRPLASDVAAFASVGRTEWSNAWVAEMLSRARAMSQAAAVLAQARQKLLAQLQVELDADMSGLTAAAALAATLQQAAGFDLGFAFGPDAARLLGQAARAVPLVRAYREEAAALSSPQAPAAVKALPVADLETAWHAANKAFWPFSIFRRKAVAKRLDPAGAADPEADLPRLTQMQKLLAELDALGIDAALPGWLGVETDLERLERLLAVAERLRIAIVGGARTPDQLVALRGAIRRLSVDANDMLSPEGAIGRACREYVEAYQTFVTAKAAFEDVAGSPTPIDVGDVLAEVGAVAATVAARTPQLNSWTAWRRARQTAMDLDLGALVDAIEADAMPQGQAKEAFDLAYARWWAEATMDDEPILHTFNIAEHQDAIKRFRTLDEEFSKLTQLYIRARLAGEIPAKDGKVQPPGFGSLAHQLKLQKRHKPVRQLIGEMGPALTTLAPCILMSPLSVAQYLPPDAAPFDLVIFDEASQITPWDAVGAIARGRQVVVAGDPKQMPPTSFFDRAAGAEEDDVEVETDQESILEECLGARLPQRRLTWHYRSRHESLIAFSNHRYYDGDLITFPAPVTRETTVSLRQVGGAWSRGKTRTNQIEAEAIVTEVVRRLLDPGFVDEEGRRLTLAVITLNSEQQKLIEDLLDRARRSYPELEEHFAEDAAEPVVVKNLETVQGDERDVVLLGIGYGPETPNAPVMAMNFGPLNRAGGWRRLNVAITRARREMMVFASFPSNLVDLNRTSSEAVRDLKHFLEYAERGPRALGEAVVGSVGGFESPFEQAVARGLRDRGWTVVPQIGVSRFRIDLGVVHPDRPGDFLAGVECDGASYHSAATARDRDKVREAVLRSLGWQLARVWSTDWWVDRQGALERLDAELNALLVQARMVAAAAPEPAPAPDILIELPAAAEAVADEEDGAVAEVLGGDYRLVDLHDAGARPERFHDQDYAGALRQMIDRVVAAESPIRDSLLVDRIARAHGFKRSGRQIRDRVMSVARGVAHVDTEPSGASFVWPDASAPAAWERARYPHSTNDIRAIEDIALPELAAAIRSCSGAEDALSDAARRFGIKRVSAAARTRLALAKPIEGHYRD
jgi:very-short-patch-repair endonuclease